MLAKNNYHLIIGIGLLFLGFLYLIGTAFLVGDNAHDVSTPTQIPEYLTGDWNKEQLATELTFTGKVVNRETGKWLNDRLVLIFLEGRELARTKTSTIEIKIETPPFRVIGKGEEKGSNGVSDGLFFISVPNTYKLTISTLGVPPHQLSIFEGRHNIDNKFLGQRNALVAWMDPFYEGDSKDFFIPSKNIDYTIIVLPGDISQLPSEIQQPGSVVLLEDNRLVAIDPKADEAPRQPTFSSNLTRFDSIAETPFEFPPTIFPINNCGGMADVKQEVTQTYIHEIINETRAKLGIEIPIKDWFNIVAEIERHYGISDKQITTYSTTLTIPAGQFIQYTIIRKQQWETGVAVVTVGGIEISAPYKILKYETFEVISSEQKTCP